MSEWWVEASGSAGGSASPGSGVGTINGCSHCGQFTIEPALRRAMPRSFSQWAQRK